jgi:alginate O-acetyltransferase complex protein AlgI
LYPTESAAMVFASPLFLSVFLPLLCLAYTVVPLVWRNRVLLAACIVFYAAGAGDFIVVLGLLAAVTVWLGRWAARSRVAAGAAILVNLGPLFYYKYSGFFGRVIADLQGVAHAPGADQLLPLGISFFTFHAISYIVDCATGRIAPDPRGFHYALYLFLFPHLIAGPIVRYREIARQFDPQARAFRSAAVSSGLQMLVIGLAKKLLIGDACAALADRVFSPSIPLSTVAVWVGVFAYTMQIYFDFSGYSDMAIGLAKMFGFRFPRNFNRPYSATSLTDFWRRWHISLSRWLRDYVYIPLGGNRRGTLRTYLNLWLVFFVCGLWHGADYTFVVWGIGHGIVMVVERLGWWRPRAWWGQLSTFVVVMALWVPFRADSLTATRELWAAMLGIGVPVSNAAVVVFSDPRSLVVLAIAGAITLTPRAFVQYWHGWYAARPQLRAGTLLLVFVLTMMQLISQGFTPFIYANF